MSENRTAEAYETKLVLEKVLKELETANERMVKLEFKIQVLAHDILQLRADQLCVDKQPDMLATMSS
jgi:hypothetical protein